MGILICGLNGVGKSTLGTALASRLGYEFIDNEDLFFPKVDLAYEYSNPRTKEEAIQLLEKKINNNSRFIFAAVKGDYGDKLINALDHIILKNALFHFFIPRITDRFQSGNIFCCCLLYYNYNKTYIFI